jgi:hypothetical protein
VTADLHDLLEDAVSDVEPRDRLPEIRRRTRRARRRRVGALGVVAAGLATAVVAVGAVVLTDDGTRRGTAPDTAAEPGTHVAALYFIGDTPQGPRLFREFRSVPDAPGYASELAALGGPDDPDYRTAVDPADLSDVVVRDSRFVVQVDRRLTPLAVQQVVFTLSAAAQDFLVVELTEPDDRARNVYRRTAVLADVSLSDPVEGRIVSGTFTARGVANSPEGNVPWRIEDAEGAVVLEGFATATGANDRLYFWETEVDVSALDPGTYTFVASTDDPSGGTEGFGPTSDTRTIVVE